MIDMNAFWGKISMFSKLLNSLISKIFVFSLAVSIGFASHAIIATSSEKGITVKQKIVRVLNNARQYLMNNKETVGVLCVGSLTVLIAITQALRQMKKADERYTQAKAELDRKFSPQASWDKEKEAIQGLFDSFCANYDIPQDEINRFNAEVARIDAEVARAPQDDGFQQLSHNLALEQVQLQAKYGFKGQRPGPARVAIKNVKNR